MELHDYPNVVCKIGKFLWNDAGVDAAKNIQFNLHFSEIDESSDIEQAVYCKKVRRAQEAKGLSLSMPSPKMSHQSPEMKSPTLSPASILMRPPLCEVPTDLSVSSSETNNADESLEPGNPNTLQVPNKRPAANAMGRIKKLRFNKHASVAGMNETKVDDIATDIIIPRERVVSICNMDKDALDDYLNEGGDSQEQEAELLQYFQTTSGPDKNVQNTITDTIASSAASTATVTSDSIAIPTANAFPLLENYQLHSNASSNGDVNAVETAQIPNEMPPSAQIPRKQAQINELRQYLQQNLQASPATQLGMAKTTEERTVTSSSQINTGQQFNVGWKEADSMHSASNSLAALSLPYQQSSQRPRTENTSVNVANERKILPTPPLMRAVRPSLALIQNQAQQSPSPHSNNFNFVPISPGPQSPRVIPQSNTQMQAIQANHARNTFLSPRRSPAVRKINKELSNCLPSLQDPSISTFDAAFKNEISASAPVSPSITPHHFQFNSSTIPPFGKATSAKSSNGANQMQPRPPHQHQAACSVSGMCPLLERSQSVPLHCQSPAFNTPVANTAYNSVCNSVAQTPVPSEFTDFSDDNILDMLAESSVEQRIKVEAVEMPNQMQADCIRSNISRSVPSTPLPMHGFHLNPLNNFASSNMPGGLLMTTKNPMDNSKSVPTTPVAMLGSNSTPFRYSPEHHRDFLINGNTVDAVKTNPFFSTPLNSSNSSQRNAAQHPSVSSTNAQVLLTTSSQPIEELPNYSDVNDPIIEGSHLMNNL